MPGWLADEMSMVVFPDRSPIILVIDDDEKMRDLMVEILSSVGFKVISAGSSEEGLAIAMTEPPDLVVCDVVLPDALGFDTVKMLKAHPTTSHVPCLLVTGYPEMLNHVEARSAQVLQKPFSTAQIVEMITIALESRPARPEDRISNN